MPERIKSHRPPRPPDSMRRHDPWWKTRREQPTPERVRTTAEYWYGRARWKWMRQSILARAPLCADPWGWHAAIGRTVVAEEVHHIVAAKDNPALFYTRSNLLPLCQRCHTRTRTEALPAQFAASVRQDSVYRAAEWPTFEGGTDEHGGQACSL